MAWWDDWSIEGIKDWVRGAINDAIAGISSVTDAVKDFIQTAIAKAMAMLGWPTQNYYVTWDWFETICITDGLSTIGENYEAGALEAAGLQADDRFSNYIWRLDSSNVKLARPDDNFCSTNPWVCLLPGMYHWDIAGGVKKKFMDQDLKNADQMKDLPKWDGNVKDILLNTRYIWDCYIDSDTISDFVMKVASGVNDACGGYWDLKLVNDPYDPSRLMIVDTKAVESQGTAPELDLGSTQSIARSWGMSTDIPDELKHSIMMGANSTDESGQNTHEPTKVWQIYGQGVKDILYSGLQTSKICHDDTVAKENTDCSNEEGEKTDLLEDFKTACKKLLDNVGDEEIDSAKTAMRAYWADKQTEAKKDQEVTIPVGFDCVFDGIGALQWGMSFTVKDINRAQILPDGHKFMITDIKQSITQQDWTTSVTTRLVLPTEPSEAASAEFVIATREPETAEESPTNVQTYEDEVLEIVPNENAEDPELTFKIPTGAWVIRSDSGGDGRWLAPRGGRQHKGVDLAAKPGDAMVSPIDGKVKYTAAKTGGMPGTKVIGTGDYEGYIAYLFYAKQDVPNGTPVKKGDPVATLGDLSVDYPENVTDHVHVSIRKGGEHLDPTMGSGDVNWEA